MCAYTHFPHTLIFLTRPFLIQTHTKVQNICLFFFALHSHSYEYDTLIKPSLASDQDEGGSDQ